jgi:hypothetical protein
MSLKTSCRTESHLVASESAKRLVVVEITRSVRLACRAIASVAPRKLCLSRSEFASRA